MISISQVMRLKLVEYFYEIAKGVQEIEIAKEILTQQYNFEPYQIFLCLSKSTSLRFLDLLPLIE